MTNLSPPWVVCPWVVDRICSARSSDTENHRIAVECESHIKIVLSEDGKSILGRHVPEREVVVVPPEYLEFHRMRKRALVNSLHEVLALLISQALAGLRVRTKHQYLSVAESLLARWPDLEYAFDLYRRLRAAEVVWPFFARESQVRETPDFLALCRHFLSKEPSRDDLSDDSWCRSTGQRVYDRALRETDAVVERFKSQPDDIERIVPDRTSKEEKQAKAGEFIESPCDLYRERLPKIRADVVYGYPKPSEVLELEHFLLRVAWGLMKMPPARPEAQTT